MLVMIIRKAFLGQRNSHVPLALDDPFGLKVIDYRAIEEPSISWQRVSDENIFQREHEWQQGMDRLAQAFAASRIPIGTLPVVRAEQHEQACHEEMQLAPADWQPES